MAGSQNIFIKIMDKWLKKGHPKMVDYTAIEKNADLHIYTNT